MLTKKRMDLNRLINIYKIYVPWSQSSEKTHKVLTVAFVIYKFVALSFDIKIRFRDVFWSP